MKTYLQKGNETLFILNYKTSKKVLIKNIILLQGNINHTTVWLDNRIIKLIVDSVKFFEPFLETHGFLRVHRTFLINPVHVKTYIHEQKILIMSNGQEVHISRRKKYIFKNFMS